MPAASLFPERAVIVLLPDFLAFNLKVEVCEAAEFQKVMVVKIAAGVLDEWPGPWRRLGDARSSASNLAQTTYRVRKAAITGIAL